MDNIRQEAMFDGIAPLPPKIKPANRPKFKTPAQVYGRGPEYKTCRTCTHHVAGRMRGRTFYKCEIWRVSGSAATDIRLSWPACGQYKEKEVQT